MTNNLPPLGGPGFSFIIFRLSTSFSIRSPVFANNFVLRKCTFCLQSVFIIHWSVLIFLPAHCFETSEKIFQLLSSGDHRSIPLFSSRKKNVLKTWLLLLLHCWINYIQIFTRDKNYKTFGESDGWTARSCASMWWSLFIWTGNKFRCPLAMFNAYALCLRVPVR